MFIILFLSVYAFVLTQVCAELFSATFFTSPRLHYCLSTLLFEIQLVMSLSLIGQIYVHLQGRHLCLYVCVCLCIFNCTLKTLGNFLYKLLYKDIFFSLGRFRWNHRTACGIAFMNCSNTYSCRWYGGYECVFVLIRVWGHLSNSSIRSAVKGLSFL